MTKLLALFQKLRPVLAKLEPRIEQLLYALSFSAVVLVIANEFVPRETLIIPLPWADLPWKQFLRLMQEITWFAYVLDFLLYGLASGKPLEYVFGSGEDPKTGKKKRAGHLIELIICLTWSPFSEGVLIHQLQNVLSLQTILLIGIVAHIVRLARGAIRQFSHNPFIVLCCATGVLMTTGAATLTQVEPQTFKTFGDAAWYVYMTTFTIGTNINPETVLGRLVTGVIVALGMGLGSVFIGFMAETARQILFKGADMQAKILAALMLNNRLQQECIERLDKALQAGKDGRSIKEEFADQRQQAAEHKQMLERVHGLLEGMAANMAAPKSELSATGELPGEE